MSRRMVGLLLLLGASVAIGMLVGEQFFQLFRKTVAPMAVSAFGESAAHAGFLTYGLVLGVAHVRLGAPDRRSFGFLPEHRLEAASAAAALSPGP